MPTRPKIFKWRQTEPALILCAVRWYLRYSLSLRDVEELLEERGLEADHTTVWRWVQRYGPELEQRLRRHLKPTNKSWRVDETYLRVKGRWCYLYRAIDSAGATIDFLLSALRDANAAKRLFRNALSDLSHPQPRVINTDLAPIYGSAIADLKKERALRSRCRHRPVQYLNNIIEQDHRAIKRRVKAKQGFREFQAARRTIQGYEAMHIIRKGQVRWLSGSDVRASESVHQRTLRSGRLRFRRTTVYWANSCSVPKLATLPFYAGTVEALEHQSRSVAVSSAIRTKAEQSFGRFAAERRRAESHAACGPLRHNEL